jgi:hypothetical protein
VVKGGEQRWLLLTTPAIARPTAAHLAAAEGNTKKALRSRGPLRAPEVTYDEPI